VEEVGAEPRESLNASKIRVSDEVGSQLTAGTHNRPLVGTTRAAWYPTHGPIVELIFKITSPPACRSRTLESSTTGWVHSTTAMARRATCKRVG